MRGAIKMTISAKDGDEKALARCLLPSAESESTLLLFAVSPEAMSV